MRAEKRSSCCGTIKELISNNPIFPANKSPCPYLTQVHLLHFFTYFCFYLFLFLFCFVLFFFTESYYPKFRDSGVIQTLMKLIKTKEVNPQSCYNAMAVLESFSLKGSQDVLYYPTMQQPSVRFQTHCLAEIFGFLF